MQKETGLMFKAPLVRAILDGRKTQTRRLLKQAPDSTQELKFNISEAGEPYATSQDKELRWSGWASPVGKAGDRIYVRETWVDLWAHDIDSWKPLQDGPGERFIKAPTYDEEGRIEEHGLMIAYRANSNVVFADGDGWTGEFANKDDMPKWRPSIHMPKEYARIWLEVTGVRLERLQEISDADASQEGLQYSTERMGHWCGNGKDWQMTPRQAFRDLWIATGGDWDANPWVWVIDFKRINHGAL